MASGPFAPPFVAPVAVGLPPHRPSHTDPLSWTEWMFLVVGMAVSFYLSVRLVTWLLVKISSVELFLELRRELEADHKPPSDSP